MKRTRINFSDIEDVEIITSYIESKELINEDRFLEVYNKHYLDNKTFGISRSFTAVKNRIRKLIIEEELDMLSLKDVPEGFVLCEGFKHHYINEDMKVLNLKTGKFLKGSLMNGRVLAVQIREDKEKYERTMSSLYVKAFFDEGQPYQLDENFKPFKADKFKPRGIHVKK